MSKQARQAYLMRILLSPLQSEKATRLADKHRQITFRVVSHATKREIKEAVTLLFDVKVDCVRVVNVKGKRKTYGRRSGKRAGWKKAYVALKEGYDINFGGEG
ncbi:MAG: 50S ribosomal protein L23 [Gammaproteobacteria bacterium]|nr:50S ribosomal protein L23 [Gammaproteobacteria bacterium]